MISAFLLIFILLSSCQSTYQRETIDKAIRDLAKKEYNLDVDVKETGETVGVQFTVPNMLGELGAEDQALAKNIDNLILVLSRVVLSMDRPPKFFVLDIADADNPAIHFVFTRYVDDIRKMMAEGLSRSAFTDRLLMEFVIGGKRIPFDPYEMDLIRLMLMGAEAAAAERDERKEFVPADLSYPEFLAKVSANTVRRLFREEEKKAGGYILRKVEARYDRNEFEIFLDLVSRPRAAVPADWIETKILPWIAKETGKIFKSYRFDNFSSILIVEKNSGKILSVPRK